MVFVSIFVVFLSLGVIQFSFSELFGLRIWFSIAGLKVMQIFVEEVLNGLLDEAMLVAPINTCLGVVVGLVTFGSDDVLEFFVAFFVEHGILIFERLYEGMIIDVITEQAEAVFNSDILSKIAEAFFAEEDPELEKQQEQRDAQKEAEKK